MKITRNMVYVPSEEAEELYLCTIHNADVYASVCATKHNLAKKMAKGIYDPAKAVEAWYYVAEAEAKIYYQDFGYKFTTTQKWTCAVDLEKTYREELKDV